MPTLRRWGAFKRFEAKMEALYGTECLECLLMATAGNQGFTPVAGFPAYIRDGVVVPRVGGGQGFADIADLRAKALGGRGQTFRIDKAALTVTSVGGVRHLWQRPGPPGTGLASGTNGTVFDNTSVGSLQQRDAAAGETLYFVGASAYHTVPACLVLYDLLWGCQRDATIASSTVTPGVQATRYQSTDAAGTWLSSFVSTGFGVNSYTIQMDIIDDTGTSRFVGNVSISSPAAGGALAPDPFGWHWPIETAGGDIRGIRQLTDFINTGAKTAGVYEWYIGHNIALCPVPQGATAPFSTYVDGWMSAFNMCPIKPGAALTMMEFWKTVPSSAGNCSLENLLLVSG